MSVTLAFSCVHALPHTVLPAPTAAVFTCGSLHYMPVPLVFYAIFYALPHHMLLLPAAAVTALPLQFCRRFFPPILFTEHALVVFAFFAQ